MYVKPSRKQVRGIYVPENYNGTAFDDHENPESTAEQALVEPSQQNDTADDRHNVAPVLASSADKKESGSGLLSLFSGFGGLRSDDILLLALILLLSRSDKDGRGTSEILPMLALLLFIG